MRRLVVVKEDAIFETEEGFWITVAGLIVVAGMLTTFARYKRGI